MGYIFIVRHGPVYYKNNEEWLDRKEFRKILEPLAEYIEKYGDIDEIYTSPLERCYSTAKLLKRKLRIENLYKDERLLRKGTIDDTRSAFERVYNFGRKFRHSDKNILIVSHSSVLSKLIEGVTDTDHIKTKYCKASLTIYDTEKEEIVAFNKCW